MQRSKMNLM